MGVYYDNSNRRTSCYIAYNYDPDTHKKVYIGSYESLAEATKADEKYCLEQGIDRKKEIRPGYVSSVVVAKQYGVTLSTLASLLKNHDYYKTSRHKGVAYKIEGLDEKIQAYFERNQIRLSPGENKMPDMEAFRRVAEEFRNQSNKHWG